MTNAMRLVKKLEKMGYTVCGVSFQILHSKYQEHLNRRAGECAPTWELLVEPLRKTTDGRIISNGRMPTVDLPDGTRRTMTIYSHYPLSHILKTPIAECVAHEDEWGRLWVGTEELPDTW